MQDKDWCGRIAIQPSIYMSNGRLNSSKDSIPQCFVSITYVYISSYSRLTRIKMNALLTHLSQLKKKKNMCVKGLVMETRNKLYRKWTSKHTCRHPGQGQHYYKCHTFKIVSFFQNYFNVQNCLQVQIGK